MPKKPPRNSFYFFMIDLKEEHRKKGIHYANMTELAEAAGPLWRDAKPSIRAKFEAQAKKEKEKFSGPQHKYTSLGIPIAEIDRQAKELQEAMNTEREHIQEMVKSRGLGYSVNTMDIYLMDVNYYCQINDEYLIGEMTVLRFNIQEGYKEYYHQLINVVRIPVGYASDVKLGSQEFGLDMPDESKPPTDIMSLLAQIIDYLKQSNTRDASDTKLPPLFTLPEKTKPVLSFIHQMCRITGEDKSIFRVYKLDLLFYYLINHIKSKADEGFPKESLALAQLRRDPFKYTPGLGCEHHEDDEIGKSVECTLSRVKRWAFTVLDTCCPVAGVDARPGRHVPADFDLPSIDVFQEQKKIRHAPSVAAANLSNTSILSDYTASSAGDYAHAVPKKEPKRVHTPLRQPKTLHTGIIRTAPELSATEFPSLPRRAGRGRGMTNTFSQLSLDE